MLDKGLGQGARSDPSPYAQVTVGFLLQGFQFGVVCVILKAVINTLGFFDAVHTETLEVVDTVGSTIGAASAKVVESIGNASVGTAETIQEVTKEIIVKFGHGVWLVAGSAMMCVIAILFQFTKCVLVCISKRWEPKPVEREASKDVGDIENKDSSDLADPNCVKSPEKTRAGLSDPCVGVPEVAEPQASRQHNEPRSRRRQILLRVLNRVPRKPHRHYRMYQLRMKNFTHVLGRL